MVPNALPARRRRRRRNWEGIALLAPATIIICAIFVYPIYLVIKMSLYPLATYNPVAVGNPSLLNYRTLFASSRFWLSLRNTFVYTTGVTAFSAAIGLAIALLLEKASARFSRRIFRTFLTLPWVIPPAVGSLVWKWILDPHIGILNSLLHSLGIRSIQWIHHPVAAMVALIIVGVWHEYPFFLITCSAGLQMIPKELYEAAQLDRANGWQVFRHITFPALRPIFGVSVMLSALMSFRHYDIVAVLTGGGPVGATENIALSIFKNAFEYFKMGYASAIGVVSLVLSVLLIITFLSKMAKEFY